MLYRSDRLHLEYAEQVATLWLDAEALDRTMLHELGRALDALECCRAAEVLVVRGGRPGSFLTGPDLGDYESLTDPESRRAYARLCQDTLRRLQDLSPEVATVAYIDGECIDAGLELALACDFRLAVAGPQTRLGFDFADHGTLPCGGATRRLPRLVGPRAALDLLVHGDTLPARAAKRVGLVDHAFGQRPAKTELGWFIADVADKRRRPRPRPWWRRLREQSLLVDATLFRPVRTRLGAKDPARLMVEAMRCGWRYGAAAGEAAERAAFTDFGLHPATDWRRQRTRRRQAQSRACRAAELPRRIGVTELDDVGLALVVDALAAGAAVAVGRGHPERLRGALRQAVDQGRFNVLEAEQKLGQVALPGRHRFADCDIVFLTGPAAASEATLLELDGLLAPAVVLAVAAPPARLAARLDWPERVVGVDLAPSLPVRSAVELTATPWTGEPAVARLFRWLERCGRRPLVAAPAVAQPQPAAA